MPSFFIVLILLQIVLSTSCSKDDLIDQPEVEVIKITVTKVTLFRISIDALVEVTNLDKHDADIVKMGYIVDLEGIKSDEELLTEPFFIASGASERIILPIDIPVIGSLRLLFDDLIHFRITGDLWVKTTFGTSSFPLHVEGDFELDGRELITDYPD